VPLVARLVSLSRLRVLRPTVDEVLRLLRELGVTGGPAGNG